MDIYVGLSQSSFEGLALYVSEIFDLGEEFDSIDPNGSFWRHRVSRLLESDIPWNSRPMYVSFRDQYNNMKTMEKIDKSEALSYLQMNNLPDMFIYLADLGDRTQLGSYSIKYLKDYRTRYPEKVLRTSFDSCGVFLLAWESLSTFEATIPQLMKKSRMEIYKDLPFNLYYSLDSPFRTISHPTFRSLEVYLGVIKDSPKKIEALGYLAETLVWSLGEIKLIERVLQEIPDEKRTSIITKFLQLSPDTRLYVKLFEKVPKEDFQGLLISSFDFLGAGAAVYKFGESYANTHYKTFKFLIKTYGTKDLTQELGKERPYSPVALRYLKKEGKFVLINYVSQFYLQKKEKYVRKFLELLGPKDYLDKNFNDFLWKTLSESVKILITQIKVARPYLSIDKLCKVCNELLNTNREGKEVVASILLEDSTLSYILDSKVMSKLRRLASASMFC